MEMIVEKGIGVMVEIVKPEDRRKLAAYLTEYDPEFLTLLTDAAKEFGPMKSICYPATPELMRALR